MDERAADPANQLIDLTGRVFGRLTVLSRAPNLNGATMWKCRCECGANKHVRSTYLRNGDVNHCGCEAKPIKSDPKFEDLTGLKFARLTVIGLAPKKRDGRGMLVWSCLCDCGNRKDVTGHNLRWQQVASCGCLHRGGPGARIDLAGKRFGKLVAVRYEYITDSHGRRRPKWLCYCDCGNAPLVNSQALRSGNTKSCGCSRRNGKPFSKTEDAFQSLLANYRKTSERRNRTFTLTENQFREITKRDCHYCGTPPSLSGEKRWAQSRYYYNGIDRLNNAIGYTPENSVAACGVCNFMKGRLPIESFLQQVNKIRKHQNRNPKFPKTQ